MLQNKSLFPARQKATILNFPISKFLISRPLAFKQNFGKLAFTKQPSDFQNAIKRPNQLKNRIRKWYLKQPLKSTAFFAVFPNIDNME